jgi:hypothetical protein
LRFEAASPSAHLTGLDALAAKGAWFQGAEANWHSNIPLFGRVQDSQVYPGVSATFYGRDGQLEYDLDVAPGAQTGALIFDLDGADSTTIGKNGDLTIKVNGQQIVLHKPLAWQPDGQNRNPVEVSYALLPAKGRNGQRIGLELKGYDAAAPLTIDPVLTFATYLSSASSTLPDYYVAGLAIDGSNNLYVLSMDSSGASMTVQKLTAAGVLVYTATFSSTAGNQYPAAIRVTAGGQAYIASSATAGYPTTSTGYQTSYPNASYGGRTDGAFSVISADGSMLSYSTYFGGTANGAYGPDNALAVAVDSSGNAYLTGQAEGDNFPVTTGAYQTTYSGGNSATFVAKFNPSASGTASLVYSTLLGGLSTYSNNVAVDSLGNAYLAVFSYYCNVPTTSGAFSYSGLYTGGSNCGYITAVNQTGSALDYSAYIGPGQPLAIAIDGNQNAYAVGDYIQAQDFPTTTGAYQTSYPDGFALELNPTGGMIYSTFLSGPSGGLRSNTVEPTSIALLPGCSSACSAYISGQTEASDFPLISAVNGPPPVVGPGAWEPFLVVLNGNGSAALTSGYLSGMNSYLNQYAPVVAFVPNVAVDSSGDAWLAGTLSTSTTSDFPVTTTAAPGPTGSWLAEVSMNNAGNVIAVPNSVSFGTSIPVNVSSTVYDTANSLTPTTIVLRNMGSAPVTLTSIVASPSYFTESDNCNGQIAASSYCTATIVFTPPNDTPVTGTLTVASNGLNSPLVVPLGGQGSDNGFVVPSPTTLNFGNVTVNTTSAPQTVTLTNIGDEPVANLDLVYFNNYYSTSLNGFSGVTNCPASLPPGDSCQVQVTFAPNESEVGPQTATLDNYYYYYYGLASTVSITGTGVLPTTSGATQGIALSATTLNFGTEAVGASSGYQFVYLTNTGSETLNLLTPTIALTSSQGSASDFQVSVPAASLTPQNYTDSNVYFIPSVAATETATLTFPIAGSSTVFTVSLVGQGAANTQTLEFQPGNVIFPDQPVGTASTGQTLYVFNAGNTPFLVDRVLASGDFSVSSTSCPGYSLAPATAPGDLSASGYCAINVVFTPSQTGPRTGTLTVINAASQTPQTIPLAGNGITAAGVFTVTPSQLDFGPLVMGTSSAVQYVTISNSGDINFNFTAASTTGDYAITYNNCGTPYTIPPNNSSCQVGVTFTPTVTTSPDNGTLLLTTSAGNQTIPLTGGGEAGTLASGLSPTSVNFGSWQVNSNTTWIPIYVRNSGTKTLTFSTAATVTGNFVIYQDYCGTASSGTLQPGQDCPIFVYFAPKASGTRSGTLTVKSNAGTVTTSLSGTGVSVSTTPSYFSPPAVSFDQQAVNSISAPTTVNFYYGGTPSSFALTGASITAGSANFQLASGVNALNTCTSSQGATTSCQVNVVYSPSAAGYETGTLTVTSNVGSFPVALSGYAPPASDTGYLSPSALEFPSQVVTTTSDYQTISLYNSGAAAFTVGTVSGTNFGSVSEFGIYTNNPSYDFCSGQTLASADSQNGAGSCIVYLQFTPSAAGTRTGTVTFPVTYSDGTTGTFTANLTGVGVAQYNEAVLDPSLATFPDTAVGTVSTSYYQYITLFNSGNLPFNVGQLTSTDVVIGATLTGDFTAVSPNGYDACSNSAVPAGSSCNILAYFKPGSAGMKTGTATFPVTYANSTTPVSITAYLVGEGIAANTAITLSPAGIQFDSVTVNAGIPGNTQTVTVTNTGNVPVTFTKATLTAGFSMYSDGCTSSTINPGGTCADYVYFNPTAVKTYAGTLSLTDNAAGSPQEVALSGVSLAATSELQFSQTTVSFGNQLVSNASNSVTLYLINRGSDALTVNSIALAGTDPGDYSESDSCAGYSLPANNSCEIVLAFTPQATGSRTATLTETDSGSGGPRSVSISGSGINASTAITFFPAALTFSSSEPAGEGSPQQFFSVTNIGVNTVNISAVTSTNAAFQIVQNQCTGNSLTSGQSCLIVVLFAPTSAAADTGYIQVTDNASGSPQKLPVSGTGITPLTSTVTLTATPTSAAYGSLFTLVAAVIDQNSNPVNNGRVTFYDGTTVLGTAQVVSTTSGGGVIGTATLKTVLVPLGSNSITAIYVGADATSTSTAVAVSVTGTYPTTTTFTSSGSAGDYTFTGTVLGMGPVAPTGSVTFTDNTTSLVPGTANINAASLAQTFVAAPTITGINPPDVVALADLNGDGIPDLVTGTETNGLLVHLGNGNGTFQTATSITANGASSQNYFGLLPGSSIAFGDFNGDGKTDIAFVECMNGSSNCTVGVLLGNGDGTFQKERYNDPNSVIAGIAVGDFNGDGILDIAVANYGNGSVDLLFGNGDGTFQEPVPISMPGASSVAAADVNGDGKLDLVLTNWGYGTVSVLLGKGNGTFQTAASYSTPVSSYPNNATLASLRNNGKLDIVLQDYAYGVSVLLGNGNGTFGAATSVYSPSSPSSLESMAVADVNGDGKPDIVVTDSGRIEVSVLRGNGDGSFQAPNSYPTGATPVGVAIADVNNDGRPDIAVANQAGPSDSILLNQFTQTATLTNAVVPGTGTHSVSGAYSGDTSFATSNSNALQLAASLVTPTMQLAGLPNSTVAWGQSLSVSVTLIGPLSFVPAPTGTVSYSIDGGTAQPATLSGGVVTIPISQLSVGPHSIAVSYGGDQYYKTLAAQTLPVTIIKANQTITFNALAGVTYGVSPITLSATSTSGLAVTFSVTSGPGTISNGILTVTGAGTIVIAANQAGNADYNPATAVSQSIAVAQAPLTVTVNSATKVYGAALPTFSGTIAGVVNGDTITATYSTTATSSSPVGYYSITATPMGSALANYSPTITPGTLTITKAALTVTANSTSRTYDTANPSFADTITGFVNGDTQSVVSGAASLTTTATLSSTVGTYPITAAMGTLSASNYTFVFANGTLTINQAKPTISWATPAAITYGTALSATQLNASSTVAGNFAYTPASGAVLTAGIQTLSVTLTPTDITDYTPATATVSLTVNKATPTIIWIAPAAITYPTALSATQLDASSTVAGTFAYTPSLGTVLTAGIQTLSVTLTPTDTADYTATTATVSLTVNKAAQSITFATPPSQTYGTPLTLSATASSGLSVSYASTTTSVCTVAGSTVTFVSGAATCSIQATQAGNTDYSAATAITRSFWIYKEAQTINFAAIPSQKLGTPLALSATASSGLPVTFISTTTGVCTVSGTTATFVATGTCTIDAHQAGNGGYLAATAVAQSFAVTKASQTITFATPANQTYGTPLTLSATASSGLAVNYASTTTSVCTVSGSTVTFVAGAAGCSIQATQTGNSNYNSAPAILRSFWVYKDAQTINFATIPSQSLGTPLTLSATASSGLAVTFISTTTSVCTVSGTTATFVATGTCTIDANQAGNGDYLAATVVAQSFTVNQETQTITFATPASQTYGTPLTLSATASSGLAVSYASTTPTICTVSGSTVTFAAGGATCSIQATQAGNNNYSAATAITRSFWVYKEAQTINFATIPSQTLVTPLALSATASSGLPVTFISTTTGVCTVSGTTATFVATGTCTIDAHQAGNGGYLAATAVAQSFSVTKAAQTITFATPSSQTDGTPLTLSATASSGLAVSYASTTTSVCTVSGSTVTFVSGAAGCSIQATQAGNSSYNAAPAILRSFWVYKEAQTITFATIPSQTVGTPLALSATASSGLAVTFISTTTSVCTVSGTTATFVAAGTCTIDAHQAGNGGYLAATAVAQSFTVNAN